MYAQSIAASTDYIDLEKSIAILISNYELESLKEIKNMFLNGTFERKIIKILS